MHEIQRCNKERRVHSNVSTFTHRTMPTDFRKRKKKYIDIYLKNFKYPLLTVEIVETVT